MNGGEPGEGLSSDFEFSLDSPGGRQHQAHRSLQKGSKMVLKRATQQDLQTWQNGQWKNVLLSEDPSARILNYFKRLHYGGHTITDTGKQYGERIGDFYLERRRGRGPSAYHRLHREQYRRIQLTTPLLNGASTISFFSNFSWNPGTAAFTMNTNGTTPSTITPAPLRPWW